MTASEIMKEINRLPNFLYIYLGNDNKDHMIILGGHSCRSESNHTDIITCSHYNDDMMEIYEKEVLEEADKYRLVKLMKHMYNLCDYRFENIYTIKEQTEFLSSLSSEQLDEIYKQIEMHKLARSLYRDYH